MIFHFRTLAAQNLKRRGLVGHLCCTCMIHVIQSLAHESFLGSSVHLFQDVRFAYYTLHHRDEEGPVEFIKPARIKAQSKENWLSLLAVLVLPPGYRLSPDWTL